VTIGDGSVVSAGSVVTKSLPPGSVAVGNPARIVRRREDYGEAPPSAEAKGDPDPVTTPA
jgi:maltose O-acetyltransferase